MNARLKTLEDQALDLPAEERARLVERLLASFEPEEDPQTAWLDLAAQRRQDVLDGKVRMLPGDEVIARLKAKYA